VEGTSVFWKTFSFAGGRGNEDLGQHASQASLLSKGAATCGAAEDSPSLSRQRVGDTKVLGRDTRRGAHAMRESFTRLCRPGWVPVTGLAGGTRVCAFVQNLPGSLRMAHLSGGGHRANAGETRAP